MNTDPFSDRDLVARILAGHPDLFGPLVERHIRAAHAIAYARLGNAADAEDAVQEAFLRAYERLASLRDPGKFGAWLLTIARHEAARVAAKRNRASTEPDTPDSAAIHPDPAQHEINSLLRDHVMRLPESAREVLLLHYFAGHSAREIAALLDLRRAAVLKRLQRARETLAETMLRNLETARPPSDSFTKQAARIAALAGAIKLSGVAAPTAAAATSIGIGVSMKVIAASLVLVATGGAIGISVWRSSDSGSGAAAGGSAVIDIPQSAAAIAEETEPQTTVDASADAGQRVNATQDPDEIVTAAAREGNTKATIPENLSGVWAVEVIGPEGNIDPVTSEAIKRVTLDDRGQEIDVFSTSKRDEIEGTGTVEDDRVVFELRYESSDPVSPVKHLDGIRVSRSYDTNRPQTKLKINVHGPYDPAASELRLSGTSEQSSTILPASDGQSAPAPVEMRWRRINAKSLTKEQFTKARIKELQELARAIFNYVYKNQGRGPAALTQLVPHELTSLQPYGPEAGVRLTYTPFTSPPPLEQADTDYNTDIENGGVRQARMIEVEQIYTRQYAQYLLTTEPIVEAVLDRFDLVLIITKNGWVGVPEEAGCKQMLATEPPAGKTQTAAQMASCQNNMKQLGLSLKMFENEDREERFAAGWFMMYPEYMPDPCVLVCPGAEQPEIAYEVLFPAVSTAELEATYDAIYGANSDPDPAGSRARKQARIPLVIEMKECSHSGGRYVLFLDGHTKHFKEPLESDPELAPFLNLR